MAKSPQAFALNQYMMIMEDTYTKRKGYLYCYNETDDPKVYKLKFDGIITDMQGSLEAQTKDYTDMEFEDWLQDGHSYNFYLIYTPHYSLLQHLGTDPKQSDLTDWPIITVVYLDGAEEDENRVKRVKYVISETGVWTYNKDKTIEDNKYTVLGIGPNPYTTL